MLPEVCGFLPRAEIDLIISTLKKKEVPGAEMILHQADLQAVKWIDYCQQFQVLSTEALLMAWQEKREPCAFLDLKNNSCLIYPIRPMVCRTWISLRNPEGECRPCNFIFAEVAQRVIERRAAERGIKKADSLPVVNWLAFKAKEIFK